VLHGARDGVAVLRALGLPLATGTPKYFRARQIHVHSHTISIDHWLILVLTSFLLSCMSATYKTDMKTSEPSSRLAIEQHASQQHHLSGGHEERTARRSRQRAQRRQRVAVGVGEAAGRRRRCVNGVNQMLRAELRDVESCVRCFAAPLAAATSELYLQGSVGRGGNGEMPGDHTPKRWSSPDMRRPRRRAAVRRAAVRHAAARCARGERRAAARRVGRGMQQRGGRRRGRGTQRKGRGVG